MPDHPRSRPASPANCPMSPAASALQPRRPGAPPARAGLPVGLSNSGTSCFLNAVLVCLDHLPAWGDNLGQQALATDLGALLHSTMGSLRQKTGGSLIVTALHLLVQRRFGIIGQEDASVLLRLLLQDLPSNFGAPATWLRCPVSGPWYGATWPWHAKLVWQWKNPLTEDQLSMTDIGPGPCLASHDGRHAVYSRPSGCVLCMVSNRVSRIRNS